MSPTELPHHLPLLLAAALLFGLGNGALTLARAELLHAHYPATIFGSVNGKVSWWVNLAQALTPFGMGWLFTRFGSYLPSLLLLSVLATLAALHKDLQAAPKTSLLAEEVEPQGTSEAIDFEIVCAKVFPERLGKRRKGKMSTGMTYF